MDTPFMTAIAEGLAGRGLRVARFEFAYMAARRTGGSKRPPPKVEALQEEYRAAVADLACDGPLVIGGKSMGGRVASLVADELWDAARIVGLLCLGYPFHPRGKPDSLRIAHLERLRRPTLVCQARATRSAPARRSRATDCRTGLPWRGWRMATMISRRGGG